MMRDVNREEQRPVSTVSPYVIRPGRPSLRTTFQFAADIPVSDGGVESTFSGAVEVILGWLQAKISTRLPPQALRLEDFEVDDHSQQQLLCVSLRREGLWSARLIQPDAPYRDRPAVPGRTWTTDLAVSRTEGSIRFGVRVQCASAPYATEPIALTRPRVVLDLAGRFGLVETRPLDGKPWRLATMEDLDAFHSLLVEPVRTLPVVVLTEPSQKQYPGRTREYLLDAPDLAHRTQALAHVVCLPRKLAHAWTVRVGKKWSVFSGAVRVYQPRLDFDHDSPYAHPLFLPQQVIFWRFDDLEGESAFAEFLLHKAREHASSRDVNWGGALFYPDARSRRAQLVQERIREEIRRQVEANEVAALKGQLATVEKAYAEQVAALEAKVQDSEQVAQTYFELALLHEAELERSRRECYSLQIQVDQLRAALKEKTGQSPDFGKKLPAAFADIPDWSEKELAGRLVLHPRAVQGLKRASFRDCSLVCRALLLLADEYRQMRLGVEPEAARVAWQKGLDELGLEFAPAITKERAGEHGDTYFVEYPPHNPRRRLLEFHLRRGSTKDDRYCLRIYFFWDDEVRKVVVGWLPSHLETRAT